MDFTQYKTTEQLLRETGLTIEQAITLINHEIEQLKKRGNHYDKSK